MKRNNLAVAIGLSMLCQISLAEEKTQCQNGQTDCPATTSNNSLELDEVSVIANRSETNIANYAGQISILNEDDLQGSENVIKSISTLPGVQTGDDYGRSIGSQFKIRGFGYKDDSRVIIEQDGVKRSPSLFSNHISTFRVDNDLLKRVEVVKGASSILHGSGAIGGIISMQTKNAEDFINEGNELGFTVGGRRESNNLKSGRIAFAVAPDDLPIDFLIYGKDSVLENITLADGGFYDEDEKVQVDEVFDDETIKTGYAKLGWDITPEMRASVSAFGYNENLVTSWQTLWHLDPGTLPVHGKLRQTDIVADLTYQPSDNPLVDLSGKIYKSKASYHRTRNGVSRGNPVSIDYVNHDNRWGVTLKNESNFVTGPVEHKLVTGIDYDNRKEDAVFIYNGETSDFGSFPNYYKDLGLYVQDTLTVGNLDLTLGGRYDTFKRGVDLPDRSSYSDNHFSPKISASYELFDGFNVLASYSETFRGPTPNETGAQGSLNPHYWYLPNSELEAETAKDLEAGFSFDKDGLITADDSLYVKATYFDGKINNMINLRGLEKLGKTPDFADYPNQTFAQYQNVSNARRKGVELEAKYGIGNADFSLGFDHLKMTDEDTDERLSDYADKLSLSAGYLIEPLDLEIGIKATHQFKADRDKYSLTRWGKEYKYINKSFTTVDLKGQWKPDSTGYPFLDEGFQVQFGVNNVLNKQFIHPSNTEGTSAVGKGRNAYFEFEKTF